MAKISKEIEDKVFEELKKGSSYSVISKKYGIAKVTIHRIKNRRDNNLEVDRSNKRTIATRRKIREAAICNQIIKNSEKIIPEMIDVLEGIKYAINNLIEINEDARTRLPDNLLGIVLEKIEKSEIFDKKEKESLIVEIQKTIDKVKSYYGLQKIRIDAINSLKEQMKIFMDYKLELQALKHMKSLLDALFYGLRYLEPEYYLKFREVVIEHYPESKEVFRAFDGFE
ncbi:MAG: hypothetical protein QXJ06_05635 [Candidatus Aenigmatarchaeota archaeon]